MKYGKFILKTSKKTIFNFFKTSTNKNEHLTENKSTSISNSFMSNQTVEYNKNNILKDLTLNKLFGRNQDKNVDLNFINDEDPNSSDIFKFISKKANIINNLAKTKENNK